ncbi:kinase-like domain-containing protein, partial [Lophiotrema nucula]
LSSALAYIHSQRIRHADVKPANILLRGQDLFISDFGISRLVSEPDSTSSSNCPSTPLYSPLEISEQRVHGRKADVFSLGCVVLELLSRV